MCRAERKTLLSNDPSPNFDFRFERMHTCFHLGRAACSNSIPTHSLRYHSHQSLFIFLSSLFSTPLCLYIIDSFGVALAICLIITCFWVTAQEEMDNGTEGA